jgi:hypothetical protein
MRKSIHVLDENEFIEAKRPSSKLNLTYSNFLSTSIVDANSTLEEVDAEKKGNFTK